MKIKQLIKKSIKQLEIIRDYIINMALTAYSE